MSLVIPGMESIAFDIFLKPQGYAIVAKDGVFIGSIALAS